MKQVFPILASALLLAGCFHQPTDQSTNDQQQNLETSKPENLETSSISGSFQDLMNMDKSMHCTWNYQDQNGSGDGEVYVSGEKFRANVNIQTPQGQVTSNSVSDGTWMYQWSNATPQGLKINLQDIQDLAPDAADDQPEHAQGAYQTLTEKYSYNCDPWTVDQSQFQVPAGVNFIDFSQTIQQMQGQMEDIQNNACSMCDLLTGDAQTQCLQNCQ